MIENFGIEIQCLYCSQAGRVVSYYETYKGTDLLDKDDYLPDNFWCSLGGFSITVDGYKTIFSSYAFYNMVKASSFLLNTIYWLEDKTSNWFNPYNETSELFIELGLNEVFKIKNINETTISISYYHVDKYYLQERGKHFFSDVILIKRDWINASKIALKEYFLILNQVIEQSSESNIKKTLIEYQSVWEKVQ